MYSDSRSFDHEQSCLDFRRRVVVDSIKSNPTHIASVDGNHVVVLNWMHRIAHTKINLANSAFLQIDPFIDHFILAIKQQKFPAFKKLWQQEQATRNAEKGHKRKDDSNRLGVLNNKDATEEDNLQESK